MEDEESKGWEIQECSSSDWAMTSRMIRRGLRIGKTIIVTGFVISSAPFVLPPLMVGLACSVPFGVYVASYACAEKLMSILLPMPKPPPPPLPLMLEYKALDEVSYIIDMGSEGDIDQVRDTEAELDSMMEKDEERLLEDTKATVQMRIALPVGEDKFYKGKQARGQVQEDYDESSAQSTAAEISGSGHERPIDNVNIDDPNLAQHEDIMCRVVEVGLTIGAIDQQTASRKEAGDADQGDQLMTVNLEGNKGPTQKDSGSQFTAKRRAMELDDGVHNTGVEGRTEMSGAMETAIYIPAEQIMKNSAATEGNRSKQSINIDVELVGETPFEQKENLDAATSTTKRKKKAKKKKPKPGETITDVNPEGPISSTADVRNIADESHLKAGEEIHSDLKATDIVQRNESSTTSRTPSGRSLKASPKKALFSEEKIWENIEALRTIVGYRVARHQTCMEELKALYIFIGVEPPPDLVEVDDKLRFLMAIVGVK